MRGCTLLLRAAADVRRRTGPTCFRADPPPHVGGYLGGSAIGLLFLALAWTPSGVAATLMVTNTLDGEAGSLRQAIIEANAIPGRDEIHFKIPGDVVHIISPLTPLPDITEEVVIDGFTQTNSSPNTLSEGNNAVVRIQLDGDDMAGFGDGLAIFAGNCLVRGLAITRFTNGGIYIDAGAEGTNRIQGNFIGLSPDGSGSMGNALEGIYVSSGEGHVLGGVLAGEANVIAGNGAYGISLNSNGNVVQGNLIGLNPAGTVEIPNGDHGVSVQSDGNLIGGAGGLGRNVIAAHDLAGLAISIGADFNEVYGNYMGTGPWGTNRHGNLFGLFVSGSGNLIGGDLPGEGNVVSGNRSHGIYLAGAGAVSNLVAGNIVGRDPSGLILVSNALNGVVVEGNGNLIGGTNGGAANLIAGNRVTGVAVTGLATGNAILGNRIFANGGLGIDLGDNDLTINDPGDADDGPNLYQNYPVLDMVESGFGAMLSGTVSNAAHQTYRLEFFSSPEADLTGYGEGQTFLGATSVTTGPDGIAGFTFPSPVEIPGGHWVTVTATDVANNTSEFSPALRAGLLTPVLWVNDVLPVGDTLVATNSAMVTIVNSNPDGSTYYWIGGVEFPYSTPFEVTRSVVISAVAYNASKTQVSRSAPLTLLIEGTPAVAVSPDRVVVPTGRPVAFTAVSGGSPPLTYQWKRDGAVLVGETAPKLDLGPAMPAMSGAYSVVASNFLDIVESAPAMLRVGDAPAFLSVPSGTNVIEGTDVTFCVEAAGEVPLQYQWRLNGANIPGATNDCLTITNATLEDGGSYAVVVANAYGVLTSPEAVLSFLLTSAPGGDDFADRVSISGFTGTLSGDNRTATREAPPPIEPMHAGWPGRHSVWYAWTAPHTGIATFATAGSRFDTLLGIYTGDSLATLAPVAADEDGIRKSWTSRVRFNAVSNEVYQVAVDGFANQSGDYVLDWDLLVTNATIPVVTSQPVGAVVGLGEPAAFAVTATGGVVSYQWFRNEEPIAGATAASYDIPAVGLAHLGQYKVRLTGTDGRVVDSAEASLQIGPHPGVLARTKLDGVPASAYTTNAPNNLVGGGGAFSSGIIPLSVGSIGQQLWSNYGFQNQLGESNHCDVIGGTSAWLVFWAETAGTLVVDTEGAPTNAVLAIYGQVSPFDPTSDLVLLACDSDSHTNRDYRKLSIDVQEGAFYRAAVDGPGGRYTTNCLQWRFGARSIAVQPVETHLRQQGQTVELVITNILGFPPPERIRWFRGTEEILDGLATNLVLTALTTNEAGVYRAVLENFAGITTNVISVINIIAPANLELVSSSEGGEVRFKILGTFPYAMVLDAASHLSCSSCDQAQFPVAGSQIDCHVCQDVWTPVWTNCVPNQPFEFVDPDAPKHAQRFYRARLHECPIPSDGGGP